MKIRRGDKVKIYSSEHCAPCTRAKRFFNKKGISTEELYIEKEGNMEELKSKINDGNGGVNVLAVPTICANGDCVSGFDKEELRDAIADRW